MDVRPARAEELGLLAAIEDAADRMLEAALGQPLPAGDPSPPTPAMLVLVVGDPPVGFARVDLVDAHPHLQALAVHPSHQRLGLGRQLVEAVIDWCSTQGHTELTLTTFQDVPFNGPFYESLGFSVVEEQGAGVVALREHEQQLGLDRIGTRVVLLSRLSA